MKLHMTPTSPYARKVRIVIREKGLSNKVEEVETSPLVESLGLRAINPLSKIPALETETCGVLYDSRVICEYLDGIGDGPILLSASGDERWKALRRCALADGIMDAAVATVLERLRDDAEQSAKWLVRWDAAIRSGLKVAESEIAIYPRDFSLEHIGLIAAMDYLDFRHPDADYLKDHDALKTWRTLLAERASLVATAHPSG